MKLLLRRFPLNILPVIACLTLVIQSAEGQRLDDAAFHKWHTELNPQDEQWLTIPWQVSLVEAQNLAAREKKPLFIWAMDGHPLGCT